MAVTFALRLAKNTVNGMRVAKSHAAQKASMNDWTRKERAASERVKGTKSMSTKIEHRTAISAPTTVSTTPL